jgi:hypothetical protein
MLKVIALAALVVLGFVVLGAVAKLLWWAVLVAVLGAIGYATYRLLTAGSGDSAQLRR